MWQHQDWHDDHSETETGLSLPGPHRLIAERDGSQAGVAPVQWSGPGRLSRKARWAVRRYPHMGSGAVRDCRATPNAFRVLASIRINRTAKVRGFPITQSVERLSDSMIQRDERSWACRTQRDLELRRVVIPRHPEYVVQTFPC